MGNFETAITAIDAENAKDPKIIQVQGVPVPAELAYSQRMSECLFQLYPEASDELRLAVRAQHIRRWEIPRSEYPQGKPGYLCWRNELKRRHADIAAAIMKTSGYGPDEIERVKFLIQKKNLKSDPETQALEDAACLVFLKYYFPEFAAKHNEEKLIGIIKKTWSKMSPVAHEEAGKLELPEELQELVQKALG